MGKHGLLKFSDEEISQLLPFQFHFSITNEFYFQCVTFFLIIILVERAFENFNNDLY